MKKILPILIAISLLLISGCSLDEDTMNEKPAESHQQFVTSPLEREIAPKIDIAAVELLTSDNTAFALAFYDQINQGDKNIIFSPISLSVALSMTLAGAEGSTEQGMLQALQFSIPEEQVHPAFNALMLMIEDSQNAIEEDTEDGYFQLNIANSIWGQTGFDFKESFLDTLAVNYGSGLYNVDFIDDPDGSGEAINQWIEDETEEKIQDLIPPGTIKQTTRLVLANAIYFNGSWRYPFNKAATSEAPFYLMDGSEIIVDMMQLSGNHLQYNQGNNYQIIQLPYLSTDFVMTVIVPDQNTFVDFEKDLSPEQLSLMLASLEPKLVNLQMPKFDFETMTNANDTLKALGMGEAFSAETADFSGMTEAEELFITDVLHKATITVDEAGTEAAAATVVIVGIKSAPIDDPITLVIDRPFLFMIQHQPTCSILFMGRVLQP